MTERARFGEAPSPAQLDHMTRNEADTAFRKRVRTIFEWLPPAPQTRILEAGCGRGFYLRMYRHWSACPLVGVELDREILQKARQNVRSLAGVSLHRADITRLPFASGSFDGVILSEVLEHIADDAAALRELWRVLKPGGRAAITVPNADYPFFWDPINKTLEALFGRPIRSGPLAGIWAKHVRLYERAELRTHVEEAGFAVRAVRAFTHHSFPFQHNLVYGLGKPLLESGLLPAGLAQAADRNAFDRPDGSALNPLRWAIRLLHWFDRHNALDEPAGRTTVNLALLGEKPAGSSEG
ncbi:MAG: methyltransferase domain-containing protein [Chloroflexi bacterium]|nr:methyltransferase domain-containing protein [Chloroflexota bacterium]